MSVWSAVLARARSWVGRAPHPPAYQFSSGGPINALIYGPWGQAWINGGPVSREDAMSVAAVERGRDEICSIATLPLATYRGLDIVPVPFLDQPDPDVPRVVMFSQTLEDLLCDGISWWLVTSRDVRGFPLSARRVVNVSLTPPANAGTPAPLPSGWDPHGASVWIDGHQVPAAAMIRFDSPGRPLLESGRRSVRRALLLDALAAMYANNPRPLETFTDSDDQTVRAYTTDEVEAFLAAYQQSRKLGKPAWIPKQATRTDASAPSPAELQLVQLQQQASLELALHMGLDPEDVGVNTTSRTYFNATDRRTDKINRTLSGFMSAITDRLSMGDVTPRGQRVRWDLTDWLKPDPTALAAYWQTLNGIGSIDRGEVRAAAGWSGPPPAITGPAVAPGAGQNTRVLPAQLGPALTAIYGSPDYRITDNRNPVMVGFAADDRPSAMHFSVRDFGFASPPATVDQEKRTITGLAVPYGAVARKYGIGFRFRPGALEYDAGNLNRLRVMDGHTTYVGVHQAVTDSKAGPVVALKILDGPAGSATKMQRDQLLMDAAGGLADGLSVGVDFSLDPTDGDVVWSEGEQVFDVVRATWNETSVTPDPAFSGARVTKVAASRFGGIMDCQHCARPHPPGMACAVAAQLYPAAQHQQLVASGQQQGATFVNPAQYGNGQGPVNAAGLAQLQQAYAAAGFAGPLQPAPTPVAQPAQQIQQGQYTAQLPSGPITAEQLNQALTGMVAQLVSNGQVATAPPVAQFAQPVNPTAMPLPSAPAVNGGPGQQWGFVQVREPDPYRLGFDRQGFGILGRGSHDFSTDMISALRDGDIASHQRALAFAQKHMAALFNVATTDVDETNPTRQRPDLYVDQREYQYPIWSAINKGALTDITPFTFPKFNTSSGLVGAHTQGTEPTTGAITTTGQTVTPTGYSGLATVNREVWDQGGNPQTSTLIWNQMVRGVNEALEALAVTTLNAGSFTALNTFTAGAVDRAAAGKTLGSELEHGIALLQFARGGYAFTDAFGQADLYITLTDAADTAGAKLYPIIGPQNRNGQADARFSSINVGGQLFLPAWALAAAGQTAATKSYLIDRTAVSGWASAPQRLTFDNSAVATVGLGVWGYQACAISDTTGVRTITWDPVA